MLPFLRMVIFLPLDVTMVTFTFTDRPMANGEKEQITKNVISMLYDTRLDTLMLIVARPPHSASVPLAACYWSPMMT